MLIFYHQFLINEGGANEEHGGVTQPSTRNHKVLKLKFLISESLGKVISYYQKRVLKTKLGHLSINWIIWLDVHTYTHEKEK